MGGCSEPLLSIVLPTYNERDNIRILVPRIASVLKDLCYEIIVVDDDSPDGTWKEAERLSREYPVRVIRRRGRRGLGSAIVEGMASARGRYIAVMDADLQHPPEVLPLLLREAERGADVVVATRYSRGGGVEGWSRLRLLISRSAVLLAHLLLPESRKTSDPMSGFFLVDRRLVEDKPPEGRSWKVLLELIALNPGARVAEVPYVFRERAAGRSKLGPRAMLDYLLDLLRLSGYRVLKFALVGATGTIVNIAVVKLLEDSLHPLLALAAGWEAGLTWNFILHDAWTFRGRRRERGPAAALRYWLRYHAAAAAAFAAYMAAGWLMLQLGASPALAAFTGVLAGFILNYIVSATRIWRPTG